MKNEVFYSSDKLNISEDSIYMSIASSLISKLSFLYLQGLGHFIAQSGYYVDRKNYDSFQAIITVSGKGYLKYEDKEYILEKGQCALINCKNHHYYCPLGEEPWEFMWAHYNGANSLEYYNIFINNNESPVISPANFNEYIDIIKMLIKTNISIDIFTELNNSRHLVGLITEFIYSSKNKNFFDALSLAPLYIQKLINYLDMHFNENISLDYLAKEFGVSKFHLCREFKRYTSSTIKEHLIQIRISRAKELLKSTNESIGEIGSMVGIENTTHFITLFKEKEGYTPLTFRKIRK